MANIVVVGIVNMDLVEKVLTIPNPSVSILADIFAAVASRTSTENGGKSTLSLPTHAEVTEYLGNRELQ